VTGTRPLLALRALGLGDALTGVPALRGLRRLVAPEPLVLAAPEVIGRWMVELDVVDAYVATPDLHAAPPGRALGPHDAVDLHGNGRPSRDLLRRGGATRVTGFELGGPAWRADEHEVDRWCRLAASMGASCGRQDLRLRPRPPRPDGEHVVVHPGAASESRRWPADRWAAVVRALAADGRHVVLTGAAAEHGLCEQVRTLGGLHPTRDTSGRLTLPELAGLVGGAALLLCGDTGVAHLATALAVPSVLLFGPVSPAAWGPAIDPDLHQVIWHGDGHGDPHGRTPDPHLLEVQVPEVVAAARAMLGPVAGVSRRRTTSSAAASAGPGTT
jgi:hypothetical protein